MWLIQFPMGHLLEMRNPLFRVPVNIKAGRSNAAINAPFPDSLKIPFNCQMLRDPCLCFLVMASLEIRRKACCTSGLHQY